MITTSSVPGKSGYKRQKKHSPYCTQEEAIARMSTILVGNGNPKEGMAFKILEMAKDIADIKSGINELKTENSTTKKVAYSAMHALDLYKKEMEGIDEGKEEVEKQHEIRWKQWVEILTLFFAMIAIIVSVLTGISSTNKTSRMESLIESLETPVVTRDGKVMQLPSDAKIKYYPSGDTIRRKK